MSRSLPGPATPSAPQALHHRLGAEWTWSIAPTPLRASAEPGHTTPTQAFCAELVAGNIATALTTQLLAPFHEIPIDRTVAERAERAGRVVREFGIRLPDALIAATALEHGLQLAKCSTSDFDKVRGLRLKSLR